MAGTRVPHWLDVIIRSRIETYPSSRRLYSIVQASGVVHGPPLCIKYMPLKYGIEYNKGAKPLRISNHPGFTWGTGTYVAPLEYPMSSAMFGRAGVVSRFEPHGWRVFDAVDPTNVQLFRQWAGHQKSMGRALVTAHSAFYMQRIRDAFRRHYKIDCVLFRPDQHSKGYSRPRDDVWMNVTDWELSGAIATLDSKRFLDPRMVVIVEDEFVSPEHDERELHAVLNLTDPLARVPLDTDDVAKAYHLSKIVRVEA